MIVQRVEPPELSEVGLQLRDATVSAESRRTDACCEEPFSVAVTVTLTFEESTPVVAVKVPETAPAGTVAEVGMDRSGLLSDNDTALPPDGAG